MKSVKNTRSLALYGTIVVLALLVAGGTVVACCGPCSPGVGSPGYWKNHPEAWPVSSITLGGVTYSQADAIAIMETSVRGDKTYTLFNALIAAKLNVLIGNCSCCIADTIDDADDWLESNPLGTYVAGSSPAWQCPGEKLYLCLDAYNNGLLCAPARD